MSRSFLYASQATKGVMSMLLLLAGGYAARILLDRPLLEAGTFDLLSTIILAIGLYGSVYGIDLKEAKEHRGTILSAISFGVVLKSLLIGTGLYLISGRLEAFVFGVAVAQIDPVSVSALLEHKKGKGFSAGGQTVLRGWSSFDDPMTVLMGIYIFLPLVTGTFSNPAEYFQQLGLNVLFAAGVYTFSRILPKNMQTPLLLVALLAAVGFKLLLGIALAGLILRPPLESVLQWAVKISFWTATVILGTLLSLSPAVIGMGIALGLLASGSQIIAAFILAHKLPYADRLHLAAAQYNGITAIGLAVFLEAMLPGTASLIAIAILTINLLYYLINGIVHALLHESAD
jgi:hypothetical protein